jgi:4-hydroxybenzoate polyprenyltransferase
MHTLAAQFRDYLILMRLHRPVGILLLLWPTLWALWLAADGPPGLHILLVFIGGTVLMRSAGCAINDYADRDIDPHVARTRERPLAAGRVAPQDALRLFVAVALIAFGLLTSLKNVLAILLAIPAVLLVVIYPLMKRHIALPQAVLGLAFSWGIPMAYAAVQLRVPWLEAGLLMAANIAWVIAYDTFYAMADREDDLRIGVRSSAIWFGARDRLITALLQLLSLLLLGAVGVLTLQGWPYYAGLTVALGCALYQQWLVRHREPAACFRAFVHNQYSGAAVFAGLVLSTGPLAWA